MSNKELVCDILYRMQNISELFVEEKDKGHFNYFFEKYANKIKDLFTDERVRNEDGESAFPLERPKTCIPIVNESAITKGIGDSRLSLGPSEFQYCPSDPLLWMHKLTKTEQELMKIQSPEGLVISAEEMQAGLKSGKYLSPNNIIDEIAMQKSANPTTEPE